MSGPDMILIASIIGAVGFLVFAIGVVNMVVKLESRVARLEGIRDSEPRKVEESPHSPVSSGPFGV